MIISRNVHTSITMVTQIIEIESLYFHYHGYLSVYNSWQQPLATIECKANASMNSELFVGNKCYERHQLMTKTQKESL